VSIARKQLILLTAASRALESESASLFVLEGCADAVHILTMAAPSVTVKIFVLVTATVSDCLCATGPRVRPTRYVADNGAAVG
jgi:hypothetical protein